MPDAEPRAVFLSYAREDSEAVSRIADAMRAFGIEVWFDQNELRGGDAWDANIRQQIKSCALFVPVISAQTEAREEGYFRREWKAAVGRMNDMADGVPFLLPVVIDDTAEGDAWVPEEFMSVHWTRMLQGLPDAGFIQRTKELLTKPQRPKRSTAAPISPGGAGPRAARRGLRWELIALGAIAIAAVIWGLRPRTADESTTAAPGQTTEVATIDDKSIAVLPFRNMSANEENAYFADGVQEDILTQLANIGALRVVSRTSVMQYRDTEKPIGQIAQELGVAFVLEGSVQRAGDTVRVTGQLIDGRTDEHVWAQNYTRDLTDIFEIQSALAREISGALQAVLTPQEQQRLANQGTRVPEAYDLFLKARALMDSGVSDAEKYDQAVTWLERATELDPTYAYAWSRLSFTRIISYFQGFYPSLERLQAAKFALDRAKALAPNDPEILTAEGYYHYYGHRDYDRAWELYQRAFGLAPNNAEILASLGYIERRRGNFASAQNYFEKAINSDPLNANLLTGVARWNANNRRYDVALEMLRRLREISPGLRNEFYVREIMALQQQDWSPLKTWVDQQWELAGDNPSHDLVESAMELAANTGDSAGVIRYAEMIDESKLDKDPYIIALTLEGRQGEARRLIEAIIEEAQPELIEKHINTTPLDNLIFAAMMLGDKALFDRCLVRFRQIVPPGSDVMDESTLLLREMIYLAWNNRQQEALDKLEGFVETPIWLDLTFFQRSIYFHPLQDEDRYWELIRDPRLLEPMF